MAKFICVMSGKGGVGKTTSAINLGLAMSKLGVDTIVMDGNLSSPNLSMHLGSTYYPVTIHDVMQNQHNIRNAIYAHPTGLKIIPAEVSVDSMKLVNFENLRRNLQDLHLLADYIIIDGSPGLGRESTQLMNLSDEILLVTNPDNASVLDARRLIDFAKKLKRPVTGLILAKHRKKRFNLTPEEIEKFLGMPILAKIPHDIRFEKSIQHKLPYIYIYPRRKASKIYHELAKKITGKIPV